MLRVVVLKNEMFVCSPGYWIRRGRYGNIVICLRRYAENPSFRFWSRLGRRRRDLFLVRVERYLDDTFGAQGDRAKRRTRFRLPEINSKKRGTPWKRKHRVIPFPRARTGRRGREPCGKGRVPKSTVKKDGHVGKWMNLEKERERGTKQP